MFTLGPGSGFLREVFKVSGGIARCGGRWRSMEVLGFSGSRGRSFSPTAVAEEVLPIQGLGTKFWGSQVLGTEFREG